MIWCLFTTCVSSVNLASLLVEVQLLLAPVLSLLCARGPRASFCSTTRSWERLWLHFQPQESPGLCCLPSYWHTRPTLDCCGGCGAPLSHLLQDSSPPGGGRRPPTHSLVTPLCLGFTCSTRSGQLSCTPTCLLLE